MCKLSKSFGYRLPDDCDVGVVECRSGVDD